MRLNPLFTTCLIVTHVFSYVLKINFQKFRIPDGITLGSLETYLIIYYPFGILDHLYHIPSLQLVPTSNAGVGSAVAEFLFFYVWPVMRMRHSSFTL